MQTKWRKVTAAIIIPRDIKPEDYSTGAGWYEIVNKKQ